jgi:hypothetical protein
LKKEERKRREGRRRGGKEGERETIKNIDNGGRLEYKRN